MIIFVGSIHISLVRRALAWVRSRVPYALTKDADLIPVVGSRYLGHVLQSDPFVPQSGARRPEWRAALIRLRHVKLERRLGPSGLG